MTWRVHRRGRTGRRAILALLLLAASAGPAAAQTVRSLDAGTRVRVHLAGARSSVIAEVVGARPDTLILTRPSSPIESRIPLAIGDIRRLEVSDGRRQLAPIGAVVGFLVGSAVVGAYNGIRQSQCFNDCPEPTSFLIGGLTGAAVGGVSFYFIRADKWIEVALPRRRGGPGGGWRP